jgi:hypothetical protein
MVERILTGTRFMGTGNVSQSAQADQAISNDSAEKTNPTFPSVIKSHPIPEGEGDPDKPTTSHPSTSPIMPYQDTFRSHPRDRQGFQVWKACPGLTYHTDGKRCPEVIKRQ